MVKWKEVLAKYNLPVFPDAPATERITRRRIQTLIEGGVLGAVHCNIKFHELK